MAGCAIKDGQEGPKMFGGARVRLACLGVDIQVSNDV